jgi:hypothetical protein
MLRRALQLDTARYLLAGMKAHPTKRKTSSPDTAQAAIAEFLNTHYTHAHVNDVGPVLGRLATLREGPAADAVHARQWNAAVSAALTAH